MGSIGPSEVLVVLLVALIVLGPNRLPDAARSLGRAVAELRRMSAGFQEEMRGAFEEATRTADPPRADVLSPVDATDTAAAVEAADVADPDER